MTVTVRAISDRDRDAWAPLFLAYGVFYETDFSAEVIESTWSRLVTEGSGVDALVAEIDGVVVGFAHYRSHPDTFSTGHDWFLDDLYTAPESRGTGAATALIERLREFAAASGNGTLRWITAESNATAQSLYNKVATRTSWVTYEVRG